MNSARITGYLPGRKMTAKAIRVTLETVDGETARIDTTWLPRSICMNLEVKEVEEDFCKFLVFTADVPAWWIRKVSPPPMTRTEFREAMRRVPYATKPF